MHMARYKSLDDISETQMFIHFSLRAVVSELLISFQKKST